MLGIGIGKLERANLQVLVFLLLGRGGRINEHRGRVEYLLRQLVLEQDHVDGIFERSVRDEDRGLQIGTHIPVENDVQAGGARQRLEHHAHVGIAELQRYRLAHDRRGRILVFAGLFLRATLLGNLTIELQREGIIRTLREHLIDALGRAVIRAARDHPLGLLEGRIVAPAAADCRGDTLAALAGRVKPIRLLELRLRPVEIMVQTQAVGLVEQHLDLAVPLVHVLEPELRIARLPLAGGL